MYCNKCGSPLDPAGGFCAKCGAPAAPSASSGAAAPASLDRVRRNLPILSVLWVIFGVLRIAGAVFTYFAGAWFLSRFFNAFSIPGFDLGRIFPSLMILSSVYLLVTGAAGIIAGMGLQQRAPWARMLALILGILVLLRPLLGTALGIYTLWVLIPAQSEREYQRLAEAQSS